MENRTLGGGVHEYRTSSLPGWRCYTHDSTSGTFEISKHETPGALVLWESHSPEWDEPDTRSLAERAYACVVDEWRYTRLPRGPMAAHVERAHALARALSDGAYIAVEQLNGVFHLQSGARGLDRWAALRRAHSIAQMTYTRLRDYLAHEEGVPYLVACIVAAQQTDDGKRMFRTRPVLPF